ncbi:bifunctional isochorismate lyase/aryl carrier protein [Paenibacillus phyllosphaerae]|uniref:isochorismatase n=1 Tax=Paenibacillus phyllosphaerae TaxID=274593 RepID=A0A7W5AU60_9BACL|nr:isochorismatase family protein [Paenibacillus phyllosphaerae]MBB3108624.1 bifunctional isochorismate lyase/aryl carrier protein [Paenibacillus phyllosphaerae]
MALPAILPYAMPTQAELPANKVAWTPDPTRAALLIHDMQQYFVDAFTPGQSPIVDLLANINRLRSMCHALGIPVIYSAQPGAQKPEDRGLQTQFWGPGMSDGVHKEIVADLAPEEGDIVLTKWRYNAFRKTNLLERLQEQGRDQLIICGIYAHIGVLMTTCDAFMQDIEPFFVADAVADFSREDHEMAMSYAAKRCAVTLTTQGMLDALGKAQAEQSEAKAAAEVSASSEAPGAGESLTIEHLRVQIAELLHEAPGNLGDDDDLIHDWGMDSVRVMSLVERFRRGGAEVTFVELAERPTIAQWWSLLLAKAKPALPNIDYFAVQRG